MNSQLIEKRYERKDVFENLDLESLIVNLYNSSFFFVIITQKRGKFNLF